MAEFNPGDCIDVACEHPRDDARDCGLCHGTGERTETLNQLGAAIANAAFNRRSVVERPCSKCTDGIRLSDRFLAFKEIHMGNVPDHALHRYRSEFGPEWEYCVDCDGTGRAVTAWITGETVEVSDA